MHNKTSALVKEKLSALHQEYGLCEVAQTDQGGEFKGLLNSYYDEKNIEVKRSTAYHPESQGKVSFRIFFVTYYKQKTRKGCNSLIFAMDNGFLMLQMSCMKLITFAVIKAV
jgi:hypothetical protein